MGLKEKKEREKQEIRAWLKKRDEKFKGIDEVLEREDLDIYTKCLIANRLLFEAYH